MTIIPLWMRLLALGALLLALIGTLKGCHDSLVDKGRKLQAAEDKAAADAQVARNRDLQRAAELRYTVVAQARDRFFVTAVKEIRDAAAPLAACPVPDAVRVRLNAAAACARGDSATACGAGDGVPRSR